MEIAAGTLVTPNVKLVKLLGEGGMGSVWIADHLSLKTQVAVKFISEALVRSDATIVERFNREAALSAQIKSPHVVQIFDHGVIEDGPPYIVMELLEGESLEQMLERVSPLAVEQTVAIVTQTAKALNKAHKLGIVHRDIKPDNIFLVADEDELHVKVLDFGIAKQTGAATAKSVTSTGAMIGTPEYMSPEQVLSAKGVDATTDLWALAVVAYRCLTGRVPFTGETLGSLCVAIANKTPPAAGDLRPTLPSAADAWFAKALAKEPGDRYRTAKDLAFTFAAALAPRSLGIVDDFSGPGLLSGTADWSGAHQAVTITGADASGDHTATREAAPTFSGTSATPAPARSRRRIFALLAAAVLAVAAGAAIVSRGRDGDTDGAANTAPSATEPPATAPAASTADSQTPPTHATTAATAPSASAAASASSAATVSASAHRRRPPPHHTASRRPGSAATTASAASSARGGKDRGF